MLAKFRRAPSPALVISTLALIVAVAGGSAALAISDSAQDKKIAKKVANAQITARAPHLSVSRAHEADSAKSADDASQLGGVGPSGYIASSKLGRWSLAMNKGDANTMFAFGPLTFTASCAADAGSTDAELTVQTSVSHLVVDAPFTDSDFGPGETKVWENLDSAASNEFASAGARLFDPAGSFSVIDGGGSSGVWVNTPGADCRFQGHLVNDAG